MRVVHADCALAGWSDEAARACGSGVAGSASGCAARIVARRAIARGAVCLIGRGRIFRCGCAAGCGARIVVGLAAGVGNEDSGSFKGYPPGVVGENSGSFAGNASGIPVGYGEVELSRRALRCGIGGLLINAWVPPFPRPLESGSGLGAHWRS